MQTQKTPLLFLLAAVVLVLAHAPARAQYTSGSDGSDGDLTGQSFFDIEIDLSQAATGTWTDPSPSAGRGIYDPSRWAVVFKYTTITIPSNVTVRFRPHPSNAPVIWLASGDVNIAAGATIDVRGADQNLNISFAQPGPGGFAGGVRRGPGNLVEGAGFGPGAGAKSCGGSYATSGQRVDGVNELGPVYNIDQIMPLIGGSGGGGAISTSSTFYGNGGAGGGAILIASSGRIICNGTINAMGGAGRGRNDQTNYQCSGAGAGGAIRLIANEVSGSANGLIARGNGHGGTDANGPGRFSGDGRISIEATNINLSGGSSPTFIPGFPDQPIFVDQSPTLRATVVDGRAVPADPRAGIENVDVEIANTNPVTINIQGQFIQLGTTVTVLIIPARGDGFRVTSSPLIGNFAASTATAVATLPPGRCEIQLRANW